MKKLLMITSLIFVSAHVIAAEHLNGEKLKALLVGSTEIGVYTNKGEQLNYWEYYRTDGVIRGTEDKYGVYSGKYTIKSDGCFYGDYDGDEYDGCYYYTPISGDQYSITSPKGDVSTVTIKKGDVKKLDQF